MKLPAFIVTMLILILTPSAVLAQKVEVDLKDLDRDSRNRVIDAVGKSRDSTPEQISRWVGVGKEVGAAMDGALGAVVQHADKFGGTNIGKYVMFLVSWRLFGKSITMIALGLFLWLAGTGVLVWSYRRTCMVHRVLIEKGPNGKKWQLVNPDSHGFPVDGAAFFHGLIWVALGIAAIALVVNA